MNLNWGFVLFRYNSFGIILVPDDLTRFGSVELSLFSMFTSAKNAKISLELENIFNLFVPPNQNKKN